MSITPTDVLRIHKRAAYRKIGGKAVIVNTADETLLRLNRTGTAVWERLSGQTVNEIAKEITELFGEPFDDVLKDVTEFLEILCDKRLVQREQ